MRFIGSVLAAALALTAAGQVAAATPAKKPAASLQVGDNCMMQQNWSCAAANYAGYLQNYPNDGTVNAKLGIVRTRAGLHKEALPAYAKAEEMGVFTYDLFANWATSLDATGDLDGSIAANRKALELVPNLVDVRGTLAAQLVRKGQPAEAVTLLKEFDAYLKTQGEQPYFKAQIASIKAKAGLK